MLLQKLKLLKEHVFIFAALIILLHDTLTAILLQRQNRRRGKSVPATGNCGHQTPTAFIAALLSRQE
jgi:hypothetical protein